MFRRQLISGKSSSVLIREHHTGTRSYAHAHARAHSCHRRDANVEEERRKEKIEFANKRTQQFDVCIGSKGDQTDGRQPTVSLSFGSGTKREKQRKQESKRSERKWLPTTTSAELALSLLWSHVDCR